MSDFSLLHKLSSTEDPLRFDGAVQVEAFFNLYRRRIDQRGSVVRLQVHAGVGNSCAKAIRLLESFRELHSSTCVL